MEQKTDNLLEEFTLEQINELNKIIEKYRVEPGGIYGIVTFYSFFTMTPRGKHTVKVCLGTACYIRGGKEIAETIERKFGIKSGETTADRIFTYETVRCLGACGLAPVIVVNGEVYGRVKPSEVKEILEQYK